jgi:hypothetical protein
MADPPVPDLPVSSENVTMDVDSTTTLQPTDPSQPAPSDPVLSTSESITASSSTETPSEQPPTASEPALTSTEPRSDAPPLPTSSDRRESEEEASPSELELYKAAHLKKEVEQEQAVSDALEKVSQLEKELADERKRKEQGASREDGLSAFILYPLLLHTGCQLTGLISDTALIQLNPSSTFRNLMPTFSNRSPPRRPKLLFIRPNSPRSNPRIDPSSPPSRRTRRREIRLLRTFALSRRKSPAGSVESKKSRESSRVGEGKAVTSR